MKVDFDTTTPVLLLGATHHAGVRPPHPIHGSANKLEEMGFREFFNGPRQYRKNIGSESRNLEGTFRAIGAKTYMVEPCEGMFDGHFTADQSFSRVMPISKANGIPAQYDAVTILSKFTNTDRQPEVDIVAQFFREQFPDRRIVKATANCEGTGDAILDVFRGVIWAGYSPVAGTPSRHTAAFGRSDVRAHKMYEEVTGLEVIGLALKYPFYHVDMPTGFLSRGHVLACRDGLQPHGGYGKLRYEALERYGLPEKEYLIRVSPMDALNGGCNVRCLGNTVVIAKECSTELHDTIRSKGYEVVKVPLKYFGVAGGFGHCGSNAVNEVCFPGGYAARIGIERKEHEPLVTPNRSKAFFSGPQSVLAA